MNHETLAVDPKTCAAAAVAPDLLVQHVQGLIDEARLSGEAERRSRDRFPIPYTFRLTPIDRSGSLLRHETTTVVGKDLSLGGIGFSHDYPLLFRRVVLSLNHPKLGRLAVEAEVVWTRPTPIGLYESGCRLVRTVDGNILQMQPQTGQEPQPGRE